jgi:colanic acid biosynthesis glycosyl transferase WcaI
MGLMKITIIGHNYFPEDSGIGLYTTGMAEFLASKHEVSVISGVPYYPQWQIHENYVNSSLFFMETINNVKVYRFKQYTPAKPNFFKRVLQMLHFFMGSLVNAFKVKKADVIIVIMPFTLSIILGWFIKCFNGGLLWVHMQDFEFDAACNSLIDSKNKWYKKILFSIERWIINRADYTSTISKGMMSKLAEKSTLIPVFFPNWIDYSVIDPDKKSVNSIFGPDTFNILYSGNIGEKQDWDFYIEFVTAMQAHPDFHFYLVGEGAKREEVVRRLQGRNNCTYWAPVQYIELSNLLCHADTHLLFQKPEFKDLVMPSKILGMMASAKPSIITGHASSEIKETFKYSQAGFYFSENSVEQIKNVLFNLKSEPEKAKEMGLKARQYVINNLALERVLAQFEKDLINKKNHFK